MRFKCVRSVYAYILLARGHPLVTDTASAAGVKELYLIDLDGAEDVTELSDDMATHSAKKTLFLKMVTALNVHGMYDLDIPSRMERATLSRKMIINAVHHAHPVRRPIFSQRSLVCTSRLATQRAAWRLIPTASIFSPSTTAICRDLCSNGPAS